MADLTIALAGNPNAGKSTIFNALTGLRQHTGNWPGKTIEKKTGLCTFGGQTIEIVDLPGTYSLAAYSPDEIVARDYIVSHHPDIVLCVVDATNLERNLYLIVQVLELGVPVVVALNMVDQARGLGIDIDQENLSRLLGGVPVIPTIASRGEGIDTLLAAAVQLHAEALPCHHCHCRDREKVLVNYGREIEAALAALVDATAAEEITLNGNCPRWLALKLLEGEPDIVADIAGRPAGRRLVELARERAGQLAELFGDDVEILTADQRYGTISGISRQVLHRSPHNRITITERIDDVVTNRLIGLPIFMAIMYVIFRLVIDVSAPFLDWVDAVFSGPVARWLAAGLTAVSAPDWLHSLLIDGALAGVGGILVFVPGLVVLFFFLALLEDSGYMARAAFVMDRFMQFIGLHGKSVIPLMLGFGCAVPAVYATRTIANRRDRLLTALLVPFMSCSARLPVYVVFALAFFGDQAGNIIWYMYVLGVIVAIGVGFILSRTLLKPDASAAFVLELPPYRLPTWKGLFLHTWENTREFVQKAGTVILAVSLILWLLLNLPWGVESQRDSLFGQASAAVAPVLAPAGFGTWEAAGALTTGFIAKELVVSSLAQIYVDERPEPAPEEIPATVGEEIGMVLIGFVEAAGQAGRTLVSLLPGINLEQADDPVEDTTLSRALQTAFTPLSALAFLVFVLLYVPCVATLGAIKQEFGGRWAATSAVYQTAAAWLGAVIVYQVGTFLGFG